MSEFVHLHVHTQYSFLTSMAKLEELAARAKELGMRAVALTDHTNMFGAVRHYKTCQKVGLQPIIGCELNVAREDTSNRVDHLVVLAATHEGYRNLVKLVSDSHLKPALEGAPSLKLGDLEGRTRGLIALTGCLGGVAPQQVLEFGTARAEAVLARLRDLFDERRLYVEIQDHGLPEQPIVNHALLEAAARLGLPAVATNDVHFVRREDGQAQLYLECIRQARTFEELEPLHHGSFEMFLKSGDEMLLSFADRPELLTASLEIAEMCSELELELGKVLLPRFPVPDGYDVDGYFAKVSREGLERRFAEIRALGSRVDESVYRDRLEREIRMISGMQYAGYFLIVWDFIREAKSRKIPVGPGRGSGAGSLVAYTMGITEIDPLPYGLLFERFLNPERVSMPDFDVDFCMVRRDEVIAYVAQKYGTECVGQIATYQNLKARSVIKDVARAMGISAAEAQRIATLVPEKGQGKMCTIGEALEVEPKLRQLVDSDPRVAELIAQAQKLENLVRHAGMHAAGVVISDGPLDQHVPLFKSDQSIVTQYDKDDVEAVGLIKFDFLGLKTLTVIDVAQRLVNERPDRRDDPLEVGRLSFDDRETYALISSGETTGVFQLESSGMQQLLRGLKPDCFEDIIAAVALYRPGPLGTGMIEDFIAGKHGRRPPRKLHPLVDEILAPTYGVPVYQEQVMQIAQRLAGYTLGGADLLRRAMGKKKPEEMQKQQATFVEGAVKNGVSSEQALAIFKEIEGFAAYGFNKSHSAGYALITYQTAYLKAHYPAEFFAATLTTDKDKIDKVVRTIAEARAWGVSVLPPDIDASETDFTVVYTHPDSRGPARGPGKLRDRLGPQIRFGLGAVRGLGEAALETMFEARRAGGRFRDLFDFAARVDARRLNKGVLEALVQCGAFDSVHAPLGISRARAYGAIDRALERSRATSRDRERGQTTLFGMFEQAAGQDGTPAPFQDEFPPAPEWDKLELLKREKAALGCYVSGHPLFRYGAKIQRLGALASLKVAGEPAWSAVSVAGMVENYQERLFRGGAGGKAAFFEVEDVYGRVRCKLRGDRIELYAALLTSGEPVLVAGKVSFPVTDEPDDDREPTLLVDSVEALSDAVLKATRSVSIRLRAEGTERKHLLELRDLLQTSPGPCPVELVFALPDGAEAIMSLDGMRVTPNDAILGGLERMFGESVAELR